MDKTRYDGDVVGIVAAADPALAVAAARAVRVATTPLPAVLSYEDAIARGAPVLHDDLGTNVACTDEFAWGDIDRGMAEADVIVESSYFGGNAFHRPLEASTGTLVEWGGDELSIWAPVESPYTVRSQASAVFGLREDQVRVRVPYIGGGFGSKNHTPLVIGAAALALSTGHPVRLVLSDRDSFRSTARHAIRYIGRMGASRLGEITGLDVRLEVDTGAYFTGAEVVTHNSCISAWGCYNIPNFRVRAQAVYTNKVPAGQFRGTGKNQTTLGIEMLVDDMARALGESPVVFRRHNVLKRGQFPAERWRVRGEEFVADTPPIDTDYEELLDLALASLDETREDAAELDATYVCGRGVALSLRHGAQGGGRAYALVQLRRDGIMEVHHNAPDLGSGVYTMLATVAAHAMNVDQADVVVRAPDTRNNVSFAGTSAQRTTVQMGNAVYEACNSLKYELRRLAAEVLGGSVSEWAYANRRLVRRHDMASVSPSELLKTFRGRVQPTAVGSYSYAPSEDKAFHGLDHWAPGAVAVEVAVSTVTGEVRVVGCVGVADAGKALHPMSCKRQIEGGIIMGIGLSLFEETLYDDMGMKNGNAWSYRIPTMADIPITMRSILIEHGDGPGPFGSKGLAQTSLPCVAPAVGAAIRDAIGACPSATPFVPRKIIPILKQQGAWQATRPGPISTLTGAEP